MPRPPHEALVQLVREAPAMVLRLIWPERQELAAMVHVAAGEFVDLDLAEYHADAVLVIGDDPARPILGCRDVDLLDTWAGRLLTARTLTEMFDGPSDPDGP